ncbi:MAG: hypothetical protein H7Z37_11285 [Pyrinomonadaceae bacterium]|nr:hypothetical protein [Pyrinomonadaceae bacterium]
MKRKKVEEIPDWAGENVFQVSSKDDVLSSFYAPSSNSLQNSKPEKSSFEKVEIFAEAKAEDGDYSDDISDSDRASRIIIENDAAVGEPKNQQRPIRNLMGRKRKISSAIAGNEQGIYIRNTNAAPVSYITLAEILPGKSLDLYLALYRETNAANPPQPFVRLTKNELREKSGILNLKTLNGHEKYLLAARIITRFTRSGDHTGSIYEVKKLSEVGVDATMQIEFERLLSQ